MYYFGFSYKIDSKNVMNNYSALKYDLKTKTKEKIPLASWKGENTFAEF